MYDLDLHVSSLHTYIMFMCMQDKWVFSACTPEPWFSKQTPAPSHFIIIINTNIQNLNLVNEELVQVLIK